MAFAFILIGGISGFFAALVTVLTGYGLWQALLNYWWAAAIAMIGLATVSLLASAARLLNRKLLQTTGLNPDSGS